MASYNALKDSDSKHLGRLCMEISMANWAKSDWNQAEVFADEAVSIGRKTGEKVS